MDAFDESFLSESDGEQGKNALAAPSKEQLIVLVWADPRLLEEASLDAEEFEDLSWLEVMSRVVAAILRQKIITAASDETALIFFNTRPDADGGGAGEFVRVFQELAAPDVARIKQLEDLTPSIFEKDVGFPSRDAAPEPGLGLKNALWKANLLVAPSASGHAPAASRRILVFAPDAAPGAPGSQVWKGLLRNAEELAEKGVTLQVIPLAAPGAPLASQRTWQDIFDHMDEAARRVGKAATSLDFGGERFGKIQDLQSTVRLKAHPQRSLGTFRLRIADDLVIAVAMYAALQPATKQKSEWVHAVTNEPLVVNTALIDDDTGAIIGETQRTTQVSSGGFSPSSGTSAAAAKYYFPNTKLSTYRHSTFPKVYVDKHEMDRIRHGDEPRSFSLLGFKPLDSLLDHHQLRSSSFLYPDEHALPGSRAAFVALHGAMLERGSLAVASFCRGRQSSRRLVALLPQEEEVDEDGAQVAPPGMHVVYLPFLDDIRNPESDLAFTGTLRVEPSEQQVEAADALISNLQLGAFYSDAIANPHLQRHYQVLEALGLGEDPDVEITDDTLPDDEAFQAVGAIIAAFKDAVSIASPLKKSAPKRKTTDDARTDDPAALESAMAAVEAALQDGTLDSLTLPVLKEWLRSKGLHVSGRKAELVERVRDHAASSSEMK